MKVDILIMHDGNSSDPVQVVGVFRHSREINRQTLPTVQAMAVAAFEAEMRAADEAENLPPEERYNSDDPDVMFELVTGFTVQELP